ncbi:MAG: hypothetical protein WCX97_00375 [Candidatus Magasanikbacteria bacterium]
MQKLKETGEMKMKKSIIFAMLFAVISATAYAQSQDCPDDEPSCAVQALATANVAVSAIGNVADQVASLRGAQASLRSQITAAKSELNQKVDDADAKADKAKAKANAAAKSVVELEKKLADTNTAIDELEKKLGGLCSAQAMQTESIAKACVARFAATEAGIINSMNTVPTAGFATEYNAKGKLKARVPPKGRKGKSGFLRGSMSYTYTTGPDGRTALLADYSGESELLKDYLPTDDHPHALMWGISVPASILVGLVGGWGIGEAANPAGIDGEGFKANAGIKTAAIGAAVMAAADLIICGAIEGAWAAEDNQ